MATNKNQHFVPRCYLKPYTQGEEGKAIPVFNIDREKLINNAPVKHQCSGSYFYGKDDNLESALQFMERSYSRVLHKVRAREYQRLLVDDALVLKRFWLLQYLRTEAASKRSVEMSNQLFDLVGADSSFRLQIRESVLFAMSAFAKEMEVIDDLSVVLLRNLSRLPFITSDDPAILTNRWFKSDRRHRGSAFGLASSGALAFLPLSENAMFIAYDSDVYSISKKFGIATIKRESDIRAFNQLQFLHCRANIFPGSSFDSHELGRELRACKGNRIEARHELHYAVLDQVEGGYKSYRVVDDPSAEEHQEALVHSQALHPTPVVWPTILQWRRKGFGMENGTGVGCIRKWRANEINEPPFEKIYTKY